MLGNAPILAISRTITVRFLGHGLARKVASTRVFKETNKDHYLGMFIGLVIGMILIYYVLPMLRGDKA